MNWNHFGRTGISCIHSIPSPGCTVFTVLRTSSYACRAAFRLEFLLGEIVRDERKVLAWNAIALGRIAVTPVGKTDASHAAGDDDDIAADLLAEILLKNTAIVDFNAFDQLVPPTRGNLG